MMKLAILLFTTFCLWNYSFSSELATSIDNEPIDVMGNYQEKPELNNKKAIDLESSSSVEDIVIDTKVEVPTKKVNVNVNANEDELYTPAKKVSKIDRLKVARRQLELKNELLVKKQIEELRLRQELAMMKRLEEAFDKSMERLDSIR